MASFIQVKFQVKDVAWPFILPTNMAPDTGYLEEETGLPCTLQPKLVGFKSETQGKPPS